MDEPLSNLDAKLRVKMRVEIRKLQQQFGITAIYVTHDQEECFAISDKVAIMNQGVIEQLDTPDMIYNHPSTEFIARFVGFENFLDLTSAEDGYRGKDGSFFHVDAPRKEGERRACIRPEDIAIAPLGTSPSQSSGGGCDGGNLLGEALPVQCEHRSWRNGGQHRPGAHLPRRRAGYPLPGAQ